VLDALEKGLKPAFSLDFAEAVPEAVTLGALVERGAVAVRFAIEAVRVFFCDFVYYDLRKESGSTSFLGIGD